MSGPLVVLSADLDSQLFAIPPVAEAFRSRGWRVRLNIPDPARIPAALMAQVCADAAPMAVANALTPFDAVIGDAAAAMMFSTGSAIAQFRRDMRLGAMARGGGPLLASGFNGVTYEKFEEGLAWRLGHDVVCLAGPREAARADAFLSGTPYAAQRFALTGPRRPAAGGPRPRQGRGRPTMVFAEQVAVPATVEERRWLFAALAATARANPGWDVVVKPRLSAGESTFHAEILPPAGCLRDAPATLRIDHAPLARLLDTADLLCTVSSTAAFDALASGVPVCVVADFGVRNSYGGHYFFGARVGVRLADAPDLGALTGRWPASTWLASVGAAGGPGWGALLDALAEPIGPPTPNPYDGAWPPTPRAFARPPDAPDAVAARLIAARLALRGGQPDAAAAEARAAARLRPGDIEASRLLVEALALSGDHAGAADAFAALGARLATAPATARRRTLTGRLRRLFLKG